MFVNFGTISNRLQRYERAKAKLNEFSVSEESRKSNKLILTSSNELLYSTIRVLSQFVEKYCNNQEDDGLYSELTFVAQFYENYVVGEAPESDYFFLLTGAAANILSDNFGNAKSLIDKINQEEIENDIGCLLFDYMATGLGKALNVLYLREDLLEYYFRLINEIKEDANSNLIFKLKELSHDLLFNSDEESAFWGLVLRAIHKKFLNNSATRIIPAASNSMLKDWNRYFSQKKAIRILWQAQRLLVDKEVLKGKSATVQLPTGVGKTKSIELIVSAAFLIRNVNLAIIVAPLRALCNEIEKDLLHSLKNIVEITALSDVLENENLDFTHKRVIVLTPEKLSFLIRHNSDILNRCGLIIFDEAHMFDDQSRGAAYEFLILQVNDGLPSDTQKVFISAIMPNAEDLNDWLTNDGSIVTDSEIKKTEKSIAFYSKASDRLLFYQQKELIEFKGEMVYIPQVCPRTPDIREDYVRGINKGKPKYVFPDLSKGSDVALYLACKLSNYENCSAIYVNSPKQIFSIAKNIIKLKNKRYNLLDNIYQNSNHEENEKIYNLAKLHFGEDIEIVQMMKLGFFPHFGDLENGLRISIEYEIRRHNIACVICTSTLAEGVNLPIRYLFLTSLQDTFGQMLSIRKFQNLIGRTARSGVHTEGSLICTDSKYYDNKTKDAEQWNSVVNLFNASKSEHCNSAILLLFDNLKVPYTGASLDGIWLFKEFIKSYSTSTTIDINNWVEKVYLNHVSDYVKRKTIKDVNDIKKNIFDSIASRLNQIKHNVDVVESIILDKYTDDVDILDIQLFAKKTLAYKMADEKKKELILLLFQTIAQKVQSVSIEKRMFFAKALSSIEILNRIDTYLKIHFDKCRVFEFNEDEWIDILIDLSNCYINPNYGFGKQDIDTQKLILKAWLNGENYRQIMVISGLKINDVIRICQKDLSYSFNLLLSSIIELLPQFKPETMTNIEWEQYNYDIHLFHQRIKYGLKNESDIAAYEFGFADRIIAKNIGSILSAENCLRTVEGYRESIKDCKEKIQGILENYPSYFSDVIQI